MRSLLLSGCLFLLICCNSSKQPELSYSKDNGTFSVFIDSIAVLSYAYETVYPPAGIDSIYGRSGFVHPLATPEGGVMTRIQPDDHYHHYGVWNPWTHVKYREDTVDFWNLNRGQGLVRFARFESITEEKGAIEFKVLHEHVVTEEEEEEVALNEYQTYKVSTLSDSSYLVDMTFEYRCATEHPFTILEYRYAGLGWRATEEWNLSNSEILTSEGKTRKDADGSTATWCIVQGELGDGYGGAIMISDPDNYNHPEPLRIWPESMEGGEVFANFAPTKDRDWEMIPGEKYVLKYRFVVYDGKARFDEGEYFSKEENLSQVSIASIVMNWGFFLMLIIGFIAITYFIIKVLVRGKTPVSGT